MKYVEQKLNLNAKQLSGLPGMLACESGDSPMHAGSYIYSVSPTLLLTLWSRPRYVYRTVSCRLLTTESIFMVKYLQTPSQLAAEGSRPSRKRANPSGTRRMRDPIQLLAELGKHISDQNTVRGIVG